jgi:hypothetical protein
MLQINLLDKNGAVVYELARHTPVWNLLKKWSRHHPRMLLTPQEEAADRELNQAPGQSPRDGLTPSPDRGLNPGVASRHRLTPSPDRGLSTGETLRPSNRSRLTPSPDRGLNSGMASRHRLTPSPDRRLNSGVSSGHRLTPSPDVSATTSAATGNRRHSADSARMPTLNSDDPHSRDNIDLARLMIGVDRQMRSLGLLD